MKECIKQEKEWGEMGLEEKVENLKKNVDSLTRRNRYLDRQLGLLMNHKHNDHEVLINIAHAGL